MTDAPAISKTPRRDLYATHVRPDVAAILPCLCDAGFADRDLFAPDCPRCQYGDDVSKLIDKLLAGKP